MLPPSLQYDYFNLQSVHLEPMVLDAVRPVTALGESVALHAIT